MFYCQHCKDRHEWPESIYKSLGKCESCGTPGVLCNDIPSKYLPASKSKD